jgi:hypothetical protein
MEQCIPKRRDKTQTPGNHPKERKQHSEHSKSLKSRVSLILFSPLHVFVSTGTPSLSSLTKLHVYFLLLCPCYFIPFYSI